MQVTYSIEKNIPIISLDGRMDATTTILFEEECKKHIQTGDKKLLIDMNNLEYISSAGLRGILTIVKIMKQEQKQLFFCSLQTMVSEVFKVSGFTSMLSIYETKDEALLKINEV